MIVLLNSCPPTTISLSNNLLVYGNIKPDPQCLLFVSTVFIKSNSMEDTHHLFNAIKKYLICSIDWGGQNYLGLNLDWKYTKNYIDISMHVYIPTALHKFQHKSPARPQDTTHPWSKPVYGKNIQLATQKSSAPKPNSADKNRVQSIRLWTIFMEYTAIEGGTYHLVLEVEKVQRRAREHSV